MNPSSAKNPTIPQQQIFYYEVRPTDLVSKAVQIPLQLSLYTRAEGSELVFRAHVPIPDKDRETIEQAIRKGADFFFRKRRISQKPGAFYRAYFLASYEPSHAGVVREPIIGNWP